MALTFLNRSFDVECSDDAVLSSRDGKVYKGRFTHRHREFLAASYALPAFCTQTCRSLRIAIKSAICDNFYFREKGG
jgi:hypothetical protein